MKKTERPPPKNEIFLGYATHPNVGNIIPGRKPSKKYPYNTKLDNGGHYMQVCCKCFSRPSQGTCSGHSSETYVRLFAAEAALKEADARVAALETAFAALGQVSVRSEGDSRGFLQAVEALIGLRHLPPEELHPRPARTKP